MKIDFNSMEDTVMHEFNGGRGDVVAKMYWDGKNRIMRATLAKDCSIGEHTHKTNTEVIYVLEGAAKITYNGTPEIIEAGQSHFCPMGDTHMIEQYGDKDLVMVCVVPNIAG